MTIVWQHFITMENNSHSRLTNDLRVIKGKTDNSPSLHSNAYGPHYSYHKVPYWFSELPNNSQNSVGNNCG